MISVIIPYWNAAKWIERCAISLHEQRGDFEFIFVNDRSMDGGKAILEKYAENDTRFVLLDNERTKGVSGARNTGIDHARGGWITFLDADDEYLPGAYGTYTAAVQVQANIHQLNHLRQYETSTVAKMVNNGGMYHVSNLPQAWFGVWNKIIRADFLRGIRFKEGLQYGEDGLFVLEMLAKDNYIHHAEKELMVVLHRFDNKGSLSHVKKLEDLITQVHDYEEFLLRQKDPEVRKAVCRELANLWTHPRMMRLVST